jgi:hypothetical protein
MVVGGGGTLNLPAYGSWWPVGASIHITGEQMINTVPCTVSRLHYLNDLGEIAQKYVDLNIPFMHIFLSLPDFSHFTNN